MARPIGPVSLAVMEALRSGPLSMADLSAQLLVPSQQMEQACHRLRVRGDIQIVTHIRGDLCRRPVALYALSPVLSRSHGLTEVMAAW